MNQESHVFILKVFILTNREPHRYPEFSIYPIEAFCFLSREDCLRAPQQRLSLQCMQVRGHRTNET